MVAGRDGSIWVGTEGAGLVRLKDGKIQRFTAKDGLPGNEVRALLEDRDGNLWVGTNHGLGRLSNGRWSRLGTEDGLSGDLVRSIYEDTDGSLWVGFYGGGLCRLRDGEFKSLSSRDGLAHDLAWGIVEGTDQSLWIGTQGGLSHLERGIITNYTTANGLSDNISRALLVERSGALWAGNRGVSRFAGGRFTHYLADKLVQSMLESRDGALWFGTWRGLYRMSGGQLSTYLTPEPARNEISVIHEDRRGTLWVGSSRGLGRIQGSEIVPYLPNAPWGSVRVEALHEDANGILVGGHRRRGALPCRGREVDGVHRQGRSLRRHRLRHPRRRRRQLLALWSSRGVPHQPRVSRRLRRGPERRGSAVRSSGSPTA